MIMELMTGKIFEERAFEIVADQTGKIFDPEVFTIVWARRFAGYKEQGLLQLLKSDLKSS